MAFTWESIIRIWNLLSSCLFQFKCGSVTVTSHVNNMACQTLQSFPFILFRFSFVLYNFHVYCIICLFVLFIFHLYCKIFRLHCKILHLYCIFFSFVLNPMDYLFVFGTKDFKGLISSFIKLGNSKISRWFTSGHLS